MNSVASKLEGSVRMDAMNGDAMERTVCKRQMVEAIAEINRLESELAALRAKLPRYANGEAFVPGVDECVTRFDGEWNVKTVPYWDASEQAWMVIADWFPRRLNFDPTAAECGEGEGR